MHSSRIRAPRWWGGEGCLRTLSLMHLSDGRVITSLSRRFQVAPASYRANTPAHMTRNITVTQAPNSDLLEATS